MDNEINLCFCSDENLVEYLPTVINSILVKNKQYRLIIHYIHNIPEEIKLADLRKFILKYNNLELRSYYKTWDRSYRGLSHVSVATMLRIFIPDIIQENRVLYLDIDLIVNADLMKIYKLQCGETGIVMKESIASEDKKTIIKIKNHKSGNCGVMMLDLITLRKNMFVKKCLELCNKEPNDHDQYIINTYLECQYERLNKVYNIFYNQDSHLIDKTNEFILHYAGSKKPYNINVGKFQYLWDINTLELKLNCFQYWDRGIDSMPPMIKYIYDYNLTQSKKYKFNLILITDENVTHYFKPHSRFFELAPNFKSDIVRYNVLDKYGGIWLDTDIFIIKDLNILYNSLDSSNYDVFVDSEINKGGKEYIGCASLAMKKNSVVSNYCINYLNNYLDSNNPLTWAEIGPATIRLAHETHNKLIKLNIAEQTYKGCNFITWNDSPGHKKDKWIKKTQLEAHNTAQKLIINPDCFYIITWTIYRKNDISGDINNFVFNNPKSVFTHLIKNIPTINVLIATVGRPSLQTMLNSLSSQLLWNDCLTVVFDDHSKIPQSFDYSKFNCEIKLFNEPIRLGHCGHGIRNKYASLLQKRDFIMHADDDDIYVNNIFSDIKYNISRFNSLYIYKLQHLNNSWPVKHNNCKEGSVRRQLGVIPYELNKKGVWLNRMGGDGSFYEQIAQQAEGIIFSDTVIYKLNTDSTLEPKIPEKNNFIKNFLTGRR